MRVISAASFGFKARFLTLASLSPFKMGATSDPEESEHRSGWGCGGALRAVASCHFSLLLQYMDLFPYMDRVSEISGHCAIFKVNGIFTCCYIILCFIINQFPQLQKHKEME